MNMKQTTLGAAVGLALGGAAALTPQVASAVVLEMDWAGTFTMIDASGGVLANTSITAKGANSFQTGVSGTMAFDTVTGGGTATLVPFDFFAGTSPATAKGIQAQSIGDGFGGPGSLVLFNLSFDWNGNYNIPVSLVIDAQGFFNNAGTLFGTGGTPLIGNTISGTGATPASDGTYTDPTWGYLSLGPAPLATTTFNTTNSAACDAAVACGATSDQSVPGVLPSGLLPIVEDTTENFNQGYYTPGNTIGMGGNPMQGGPFKGFNANFDVQTLTLSGVDTARTIGPYDVGPEGGVVPVPAAVWLFGSGLVGLVGVARRKKA